MSDFQDDYIAMSDEEIRPSIPGPSMGLNQIIDAFTMQIVEERSKENKYYPLRPSAAGKCEMELGYEYMENQGYAKYEKELTPPAVHRLLNLGGNIEYHANNEMRSAFAKMPQPIQMKYKQQVVTICRLGSGKIIEGSIDLWLETPEWRCLADWKSKADRYSQFFKSSWDEFVEKLVATGFAHSFGEDAVYITDLEGFLANNKDAFFNNNLYQLNLYACTEFARERKLTFCSIMQYSKNDSRIREIRFTPSQAVADKVIAKFQKVAEVIDRTKKTEELTREYTLGSQKCGFCSFKKQCYPEDDALKLYFKTFPPKQWSKDFDRLPTTARTQLEPLFQEFLALDSTLKKQEQAEEKIVKVLDGIGVYKVKFTNGHVYQMKRLKSGGPGNGERYVLRRSKD